MLFDNLPTSSQLQIGTASCVLAFLILLAWHFLEESCKFTVLLILGDWIGYFGVCLLTVIGTTHLFSDAYSNLSEWAQKLYAFLVWGVFWVLSDKVFAYVLRRNNCSVPRLLFIFDHPGKEVIGRNTTS